MSLRKTVSRHMVRVTTTTGKVGMGQILDIPDTTRVTNMNPIRRLFRVAHNSPIEIRDIIILPDGSKFIVAKHGTGWGSNVLYKHYMIFEINEQMTWKRTTLDVDPVSGLDIPGASTESLIWVITRPLLDVTDSRIGVAVDVDHIITDAAIKPGDRVNNRAVTDVTEELGLIVAKIEHG